MKQNPGKSHIAAAACIVLAGMMIFPGISTVHGQEIETIPAAENLIQVCTMRTYSYSDSHHEMEIHVPRLSDPKNSDGARQVNQAVDALTAQLAEDFYEAVASTGNRGYGAVYADYEILMNQENWFTLQLIVNTVSGSSNHYSRIYNIDRTAGTIVNLSDLFCTDAFAQILKQNILTQMEQQTKKDSSLVYFTGSEADMWQLSPSQNFYFDASGQLIIPFDKYQVAPGYMGAPQFTIPKEMICSILKPEYQNIAA